VEKGRRQLGVSNQEDTMGVTRKRRWGKNCSVKGKGKVNRDHGERVVGKQIPLRG